MRYLIRFIVLIAKKAVVILLVLGLVTTAFTSAMNISNMFILLNDGMELRANVVLGNKDGSELFKYFSQDFLDHDALLENSPYTPYRMSGSSYSLKVKYLWAWPWQTTCNATVEERVIVEGYLRTEHQTPEQLASPDKIPAPYWENAQMRVTLRKQNNGSWIITRVEKLTVLPTATARPLL